MTFIKSSTLLPRLIQGKRNRSILKTFQSAHVFDESVHTREVYESVYVAARKNEVNNINCLTLYNKNTIITIIETKNNKSKI